MMDQLPSLLLEFALLMQASNGAFPAVAADQDRVHVVWQDKREGNYEIYYSQSIKGGAFSEPVNISRSAGISDLPRVKVRGDRVYVVWSDNSSGAYQIMLARSDDGGEVFLDPSRLSDGMTNTGPAHIAIDETRFFVVWDEVREGHPSIMLSKDGGPPRAISRGKGGFLPRVAVSGDRVVVVWFADSGLDQEILAVRSEDGGRSFSEPTLISVGQRQAYAPSIAIDGAGRAFIVWHDRTAGKFEIFLSVLGDEGEAFTTPKQISTSDRDSIFASIEVVRRGEAAISWLSGGVIVYGQISRRGDWRSPSRLLNAFGSAGPPQLAIDGREAIVVWDELGATSREIFVSRGGRAAQALMPD